MLENRCVLIVEDGNEYLDNLTRFVPGPRYLQAHHGAVALELLRANSVDLIYMDMRFDRIEHHQLLGDLAWATKEHNQDAAKGLKYLQNNQGLFVLEAIRKNGFGQIPVILAYDFSREEKRWEHLRKLHSSLRWVPDAVTPGGIEELMGRLMGPR